VPRRRGGDASDVEDERAARLVVPALRPARRVEPGAQEDDEDPARRYDAHDDPAQRGTAEADRAPRRGVHRADAGEEVAERLARRALPEPHPDPPREREDGREHVDDEELAED